DTFLHGVSINMLSVFSKGVPLADYVAAMNPLQVVAGIAEKNPNTKANGNVYLTAVAFTGSGNFLDFTILHEIQHLAGAVSDVDSRDAKQTLSDKCQTGQTF